MTACMYIYHVYALGQKKVRKPLNLELQTAVNTI